MYYVIVDSIGESELWSKYEHFKLVKVNYEVNMNIFNWWIMKYLWIFLSFFFVQKMLSMFQIYTNECLLSSLHVDSDEAVEIVK